MAFSKKFYVGFRAVDAELKLKNSEMLNLFVDMATMHAETCGEVLGQSERRWLLHGYRVNILKRPEYGTEIEISTWPTYFKNITSTREFEIRDGEGNLLVTALSDWARVNIETRKPVKITSEEIEAYNPDSAHSNYNEARMPRISEPESCDSEQSFLADWMFMDMYGHMNNTYYLDIAQHALPEEKRAAVSKLDFDIVYKQEITENTEIKCCFSEDDEAYTVSFKSADGVVLHAIVKFYKAEDSISSETEEKKQ